MAYNDFRAAAEPNPAETGVSGQKQAKSGVYMDFVLFQRRALFLYRQNSQNSWEGRMPLGYIRGRGFGG